MHYCTCGTLTELSTTLYHWTINFERVVYLDNIHVRLQDFSLFSN